MRKTSQNLISPHNSRLNKKGQEEVVGFVAIIVIIVVVLLIIISISLRKDPGQSMKHSTDLAQFLESAVSVTTPCATDYEPKFSSLAQLLRECQGGISQCTSGAQPCDVARETFQKLLLAWNVGPDKPRTGYNLTVTFESKDNSTSTLFSITQGNCTQRAIGADQLTSASGQGTILTSFMLCYAPAS